MTIVWAHYKSGPPGPAVPSAPPVIGIKYN